jgi:hypothetical protein
MWLITQWYPPRKTGLRMSIFYFSSAGSGAFSGLLAAGIAQMDGIVRAALSYLWLSLATVLTNIHFPGRSWRMAMDLHHRRVGLGPHWCKLLLAFARYAIPLRPLAAAGRDSIPQPRPSSHTRLEAWRTRRRRQEEAHVLANGPAGRT